MNSLNHHPWLRAVSTTALLSLLAVALLLVALGGYQWGLSPADAPAALRLVAAGLAVGGLGALLHVIAAALLKSSANSFRMYNALLDLGELMRRQVEHARATAETSAMSDWAKRIVYREKDYEFLRDTILGAFVRQDWAMAEHLIGELAGEFGFPAEAAQLREEMSRRRELTHEEQIASALERFDSLCNAQKWHQARRECDRLASLFPQDPRIAGLPQEIELRRNQYKRRLLREYEQTVRHGEVERAHTLLIELDHYLSANEAAAMKESARGVFKAKMQQMGVEFSIAVSEKRYDSAIDVGVALIREFPNSRFAHEIEIMLPRLRERAGRQDSAVARP
ncbi:MAG: hypothetical protein IPM64_02050 [Phycisphaerales bacterium]|nr:hypothetical protein [Phycisphaerales bacterium]